MTLSLAFAAALLTTPAPTPELPNAPAMRVVVGDLDFSREADIDRFLDRLVAASRAFCDDHRALATPHQSAPDECRRGMNALGLRALPRENRSRIVRSGKLIHLSRR